LGWAGDGGGTGYEEGGGDVGAVVGVEGVDEVVDGVGVGSYRRVVVEKAGELYGCGFVGERV